MLESENLLETYGLKWVSYTQDRPYEKVVSYSVYLSAGKDRNNRAMYDITCRYGEIRIADVELFRRRFALEEGKVLFPDSAYDYFSIVQIDKDKAQKELGIHTRRILTTGSLFREMKENEHVFLLKRYPNFKVEKIFNPEQAAIKLKAQFQKDVYAYFEQFRTSPKKIKMEQRFQELLEKEMNRLHIEKLFSLQDITQGFGKEYNGGESN